MKLLAMLGCLYLYFWAVLFLWFAHKKDGRKKT